MGVIKSVAKKLRPVVRKATGYDVVSFPGIRHPHLRNQVLRRLQADLVLDVGANTGQFGTDLRSYGYAGSIISYEPMQQAFRSLSRLSASDAKWTAVQTAVGAEPGTLDLHVAGNSISSSLLPMLDRHVAVAPKSGYVGTERVTIERLDVLSREDVAAAQSPFLKIDTQGYEGAVLDGATGILERVTGIELELSLVALYEGQSLMPELVDRLGVAGFRLWTVSPGLVDADTGETLQVDGIFVRAAALGTGLS